jgi:acyl-CoA thioesterase YciA
MHGTLPEKRQGQEETEEEAQRQEAQEEVKCESAAVADPCSDDRCLSIKVVMMPRDTNLYGTIFGGVTLSYIDQAAAVGAQHEIQRSGWPDQPIVSVAMNGVEFQQPVFVGDIVSFWTKVVKLRTTSITMHVDVEADRRGEIVHLTEAEVTYVAVNFVDGQRRPVSIRGV